MSEEPGYVSSNLAKGTIGKRIGVTKGHFTQPINSTKKLSVSLPRAWMEMILETVSIFVKTQELPLSSSHQDLVPINVFF